MHHWIGHMEGGLRNRYGWQVGGTHPTGMLNCLFFSQLVLMYRIVFTGRNEVVAKVMFLHVSVIHFVHRGGSPENHSPGTRQTPPAGRTPQNQADTPPGPGRPPLAGRTPPGPGRHHPFPWQGEPPTGRTPQQGEHPPTKENPPRPRKPPQPRQTLYQGEPPWEEDCSIWSMSGQYASYWNNNNNNNLFTNRVQ